VSRLLPPISRNIGLPSRHLRIEGFVLAMSNGMDLFIGVAEWHALCDDATVHQVSHLYRQKRVASSPAATLASTAEVLQIPDIIAAPQRSGSILRRTRL
jgi:hypothetical protein